MNSHRRTKLDGNSGRWPDIPTSGTLLFIQAWPLPSHRRQEDNSVIFQDLSGDRIISNDACSRSWSFLLHLNSRRNEFSGVVHFMGLKNSFVICGIILFFLFTPKSIEGHLCLFRLIYGTSGGNDSGINDHILHVCVYTPCCWFPSILFLSASPPPNPAPQSQTIIKALSRSTCLCRLCRIQIEGIKFTLLKALPEQLTVFTLKTNKKRVSEMIQ